MVKLTNDLIQKYRSKSRINIKSHLYLNNKSIEEIDEITTEKNVSVLYLHNNQLTNVANLLSLQKLTHLYLQWNNIQSISDLNNLPNLSNLYLGYNRIQTVNGLKGMPNLQILQLQNQKPSTKTLFSFDPDTTGKLSKSLIELNVSGNNITSMAMLQPLRDLVDLNVSHNLLMNLKDICESVKQLKKLKNLNITANPIAKNKKYEWEIVASSFSLEIINVKTVSSANRIFLQTLKLVKNKREKRNAKRTEFSSETKNYVHQLPLEFREIVSKSIIYNRNERMQSLRNKFGDGRRK